MKRRLLAILLTVFVLATMTVNVLATSGDGDPFGCDHVFSGGVCTKCLYTCPHDNKQSDMYDEGGKHYSGWFCADCGVSEYAEVGACEHVYLNGMCTKCGEVCQHLKSTEKDSSSDVCADRMSYCDECGMIVSDFYCKHDYTEGVCTNCGYKCTHVARGELDECPTCSKSFVIVCDHAFSNGVCTKCGEVCKHENSLGDFYYNDEGYHSGWYCTDCGVNEYVTTTHDYVNGTCTSCGHVCEHTVYSDDYKCLYCAEKHPVYYNVYQEGYIAGHEIGHTEGIFEGVEKGKTEGYENGYNEGYRNGFCNGEIKGQEADVSEVLPKAFDGLFESANDFFSTFLSLGIGSVTIGSLLSVALVVCLVVLIIKIIRGS